MVRVEFRKRFLTGHLEGQAVIEIIITDHPESFLPGIIYKTIEGEVVEIEQCTMELI